jgi:hypothetical protein
VPKSRLHPAWDASGRERTPHEHARVQQQRQEKQSRRIPPLYVPLPAFGWFWAGLLPHTVFNRLGRSQTVASLRNCCKLSPAAAIRRKSSPSAKNFSLRVPKPLSHSLGIEGLNLPDNWIPETRNRLARRRAKKPDTKAGQLWALWPEIKAALAEGQSVRTVVQWLEEDAGIVVSIGSFTSYVSRNRRREAAQRTEEAARTFARAHESKAPTVHRVAEARPEPGLSDQPQTTESDPIARNMAALRKRRFDIREAHSNGDPSKVRLI